MAEVTILETNDSGDLRIPAAVVGAGPRARFRLEHEGEALRLVPEVRVRLWEVLPAAERVRALREWVSGLPRRGKPPLASEALRRENLYD